MMQPKQFNKKKYSTINVAGRDIEDYTFKAIELWTYMVSQEILYVRSCGIKSIPVA